MKEKRIVVLSDLHCGHKCGLTPKRWQVSSEEYNSIKEIEELIWEFVCFEMKQIKSIDALLLNGDMIDGRGEKSGGTELITTDPIEQCDIATHCIKHLIGSRKTNIIMTYGTPYHTGKTNDYENIIASNLSADICDEQRFNIHNLNFYARHKINKAGMPHTQSNTIAKQWLWNAINSSINKDTKFDFFIFSHIHDYNMISNGYFTGLTTPGLEWNSKYGKRECTGKIDIGFIEIVINSRDNYYIIPHILKINFNNKIRFF